MAFMAAVLERWYISPSDGTIGDMPRLYLDVLFALTAFEILDIALYAAAVTHFYLFHLTLMGAYHAIPSLQWL